MSRAGVKTRLAKPEAQRPRVPRELYVPPAFSAAWLQEFWSVCEESGYLRDILRSLDIPEQETTAFVEERNGFTTAAPCTPIRNSEARDSLVDE